MTGLRDIRLIIKGNLGVLENDTHSMFGWNTIMIDIIIPGDKKDGNMFTWYDDNKRTPNSRYVHGKGDKEMMPFKPNKTHKGGRHPFNILTEEIYG